MAILLRQKAKVLSLIKSSVSLCPTVHIHPVIVIESITSSINNVQHFDAFKENSSKGSSTLTTSMKLHNSIK